MNYATKQRRIWDEVLMYDHWEAYDEILLALDSFRETRTQVADVEMNAIEDKAESDSDWDEDMSTDSDLLD